MAMPAPIPLDAEAACGFWLWLHSRYTDAYHWFYRAEKAHVTEPMTRLRVQGDAFEAIREGFVERLAEVKALRFEETWARLCAGADSARAESILQWLVEQSKVEWARASDQGPSSEHLVVARTWTESICRFNLVREQAELRGWGGARSSPPNRPHDPFLLHSGVLQYWVFLVSTRSERLGHMARRGSYASAKHEVDALEEQQQLFSKAIDGDWPCAPEPELALRAHPFDRLRTRDFSLALRTRLQQTEAWCQRGPDEQFDMEDRYDYRDIDRRSCAVFHELLGIPAEEMAKVDPVKPPPPPPKLGKIGLRLRGKHFTIELKKGPQESDESWRQRTSAAIDAQHGLYQPPSKMSVNQEAGRPWASRFGDPARHAQELLTRFAGRLDQLTTADLETALEACAREAVAQRADALEWELQRAMFGEADAQRRERATEVGFDGKPVWVTYE